MNIEELSAREMQYRRIALEWFAHAHPELPAWKVAKMVDEMVESHIRKASEATE